MGRDYCGCGRVGCEEGCEQIVEGFMMDVAERTEEFGYNYVDNVNCLELDDWQFILQLANINKLEQSVYTYPVELSPLLGENFEFDSFGMPVKTKGRLREIVNKMVGMVD